MNAQLQMNVEVVSPAKSLAKLPASLINVAGKDGYLGILPGHAALVTELGLGELRIEHDGKNTLKMLVNGGYMEVVNDQVIVLVDSAETREQIDVDRAKRARERALERLASKDSGVDVARAQSALARANARLTFAG
ncbi:MAG: synthase epsilon chain [Pseudomonadota bacterium]|jgi:F-type H+-transporting ATPase subunit epsilon